MRNLFQSYKFNFLFLFRAYNLSVPCIQRKVRKSYLLIWKTLPEDLKKKHIVRNRTRRLSKKFPSSQSFSNSFIQSFIMLWFLRELGFREICIRKGLYWVYVKIFLRPVLILLIFRICTQIFYNFWNFQERHKKIYLFWEHWTFKDMIDK